ncbi:MAG: sensor histidine kinase [Chloroflexota bacterium]|nr:sensor histidine kinase [Chloroflexota bacterium]
MERQVGAQTDGVGPGELRQWRALAWATEHPGIGSILLDGGVLAIIVAAFLGFGDPDFDFHLLWVLLAAHAFVFGLWSTLVRIFVATTALVLYSRAYEAGLVHLELDLAAWPLMFVVAVIVAVMAEWRTAAGLRYAHLYRLTSDRLLTANEDERGRLALDLHDGVGQTLAALGLTLEAAGTAPLQERPELILRARELVAVATSETRDVAERLRPIRLDGIGLAATIHRLAAQAGMPVRVSVASNRADGRDLDPEVAVSAFRVVQEALGNAARHAHASGVSIALSRRGQTLTIDVIDDGRGFNVGEAGVRGLGVAGMRERAAMIGATLSLRSAPGAGTRVRLSVPVGPPVTAGNETADPDGTKLIEPAA